MGGGMEAIKIPPGESPPGGQTMKEPMRQINLGVRKSYQIERTVSVRIGLPIVLPAKVL
jgi:hypothetical protein